MEVYRRYASREHDRRHFTKDVAPGHIRISPLCSSFDSPRQFEPSAKSVEYWEDVFENAAFFSGHDPLVFGSVITAVFKHNSTDKLCTLSITKYGCNVYENLMIDSSSRFWPACQNLPENMRRSNVRRALAVSNLKNYNKLWNNKGLVEVSLHWDETNAGNLAASMQLVDSLPSKDLGHRILAMGILQELTIPSLVVDVVYDNTPGETNEQIIEDNNKLVLCLGEQLDLLFDPLLEYSPQAMDIEYQVPTNPKKPALSHNVKIDQVMDELIAVQTNYTNDLVKLLQNFIIPLRVSVLASSSNSGMMKVNLAFPPTIDEITRVNCIVHYLLSEARECGYVEVFKVLGSFLRFFYKAFVRHQANLSNFNARFDKFVENNFAYAFESPSINIGQFTPKAIKTIIVDLVLELPRLKLIIKRLYETIKDEKARLKISKAARADEDAEIDAYYSSAMSVIDSFGFQETETDSKARVFTPSGKLLTEWATEWPSELQYGWISRKVVGIFNLSNTKTTAENDSEIAIVFSDHILFLETLEPFDENTSHIVPDILMNSLVNQKPLPKLSTLPKLRVKYWCPITNLVLKSFESEDGYCLNFTTLSGNRLKNKDETEILFVENYRIPQLTNSFSTCNKIIDVVSKAQVLCKSTPFHLFKYDEGDLQRYFCAHEYDRYDEEISKSPIALFLNMEDDKLMSVMQNNPLIFFVLSISSVNDHTVSLVGRDRQENLKIEEIVSLDDLKHSLKDIVVTAIDAMFHSSYFSKVITEGNLSLINHFILLFGSSESQGQRLLLDSPFPNQEDQSLKNNTIQRELVEASHSKQTKTPKAAADLKNSQKATRRKSGIFRIFEKLKHKSEQKESQVTSERKPKKQDTTTIPNTYIPKGKKKVYKNLYKPEPLLRDASITSSAQVQEIQPPPMPQLQLHSELNSTPLYLPTETSGQQNEEKFTAIPRQRGEGVVDVPYPTTDFAFPETRTNSFITAETLNVPYAMAENASPDPRASSYAVAEGIEIPYPEAAEAYPEARTTSYATGSSSNYNDSLDLEKFISATNHHETEPNGMEKFSDQPISTSNVQSHSNSVNTTLYNPLEDAQTLVNGQCDSLSPQAVEFGVLPKDFHEEEVPAKQPVVESVPVPFLKISQLESPEKPPMVPPHKITSLFEKKPAPKRIISGQEIAKALDNINAIGILPEVHNRYKIYDLIPNSVFSTDGTSNWTCTFTESSSNLQAEIRAMKEEAHMDTEDVIDLNLNMAEISDLRANISTGTVITDHCSVVDLSCVERIPVQNTAVLKQMQRDESVQSLTPEQLAAEFGTQLDQDFDLDGIDLERSLSTLTTGKLDPINFKSLEPDETLFHSLDFGEMDFDSLSSDKSTRTEAVEVVAKTRALGQKRQLLTSAPNIVVFEPLQAADSSTTDEEYFLSSEIMSLNYYLSEKISTGVPSSPSSDKTLKNEAIYIEKGDMLFDEKLRSESVAFLSGILRGEIEI